MLDFKSIIFDIVKHTEFKYYKIAKLISYYKNNYFGINLTNCIPDRKNVIQP